ncbi:MAG: hypothetical protein NTU84_00605 [Verrucomicrobia bacterium]|nr:hypothetical protein [Verrucomicrobiota bacterium]
MNQNPSDNTTAPRSVDQQQACSALAQQLREAADIIESGLEWSGTRTLHGGKEQTVGSKTHISVFGVGPVRAIELGYTIVANREQNDELSDSRREKP